MKQNLKQIAESRFNGLVDAIDYYFHLSNMVSKPLSKVQKKDLKDIANQLSVFGKKAEKWIGLANEMVAFQ